MSIKHKEYISKLSLKDKAEATVMQNGRCFVIESVDNNGIWIGDNPRENADYIVETKEEREKGYHPVAYPQAAAQAATWDLNVTEQIGAAMGRECRKQDMNILLRPGVNIKRSPLCGRNFEYYSEDPVLSGKMGSAFIKGVQKEGTAACLKHFAVNSQEFERMTTNAVVSQRALRELYLKPFKIAVKESDPWSVMTSYNKVNGHWVPANEDLMGFLRGELGYDGAVISDAMAVHTEKVESHRNGLDFEIGSRGLHSRELQEAVRNGSLDESILDQNIDHLLTIQEKTGRRGAEIPDNYDEEHALARIFAAESVVLLKNDGILPLNGAEKIAVIGKLAMEPNYMGCGSGHMNGHQVEITYDEIGKYVNGDVLYAEGYEARDRAEKPFEIQDALVKEAAETAGQADVVLFFAGLPVGYESEGYDRADLELPADMKATLEAVLQTGKKVVLVNVSGSPVNLAPYTERVAAVVHSYLSGEALGGALADVLYGRAEPAGRLPETFPLRIEDTPSYLSFPRYPTVMPDVYYGEDIFVGYRWYEKRKMNVLYPFGYGLSYTEFAYTNVRADKENYAEGDNITVSVDVKNTGARKGAAVVEIYMNKVNGGFYAPEKELQGFAKVWLEPGEEKTVSVAIAVEDLGSYDEVHKTWVREPGAWRIVAGTSVIDPIAEVTVDLEGNRNAQVFQNLTAVEWMKKDERTAEILADKSEAARQTFAPNGSTMEDLVLAIPSYRFTEDSLFMGEATFSPVEFSDILDAYNKKRQIREK